LLAQLRRLSRRAGVCCRRTDRKPGFVDLIGLYAGDIDTRLARQVRAEGIAVWVRHRAAQS